VNTFKFKTKISELPYSLYSEDQITSVKLHFLPRKLRGILVFSHQREVFVLQLGMQWNLEQTLKGYNAGNISVIKILLFGEHYRV